MGYTRRGLPHLTFSTSHVAVFSYAIFGEDIIIIIDEIIIKKTLHVRFYILIASSLCRALNSDMPNRDMGGILNVMYLLRRLLSLPLSVPLGISRAPSHGFCQRVKSRFHVVGARSLLVLSTPFQYRSTKNDNI